MLAHEINILWAPTNSRASWTLSPSQFWFKSDLIRWRFHWGKECPLLQCLLARLQVDDGCSVGPGPRLGGAPLCWCYTRMEMDTTGSGWWRALSSGAATRKQGSLAGELGWAKTVGPRMGNRKGRGEVGRWLIRPDKVLKFENGFLFILIWFKL
jgi:hypothetical protein